MSRENTHLLNILFFKKGNNLSFCFACVDVHMCTKTLCTAVWALERIAGKQPSSRGNWKEREREIAIHRASERARERGRAREQDSGRARSFPSYMCDKSAYASVSGNI